MGCDVACVNHDGGGQEGVSNHNSLVIGPLGRVSCERVRIAGSGDCECRTKGGVLGGDRLLPSKNIAERVVRVCSGAQMAVSGTSTGESRRVRPVPGGLLVPRRKVDCKLGFGPGTHGRKDCQFKAKLSQRCHRAQSLTPFRQESGIVESGACAGGWSRRVRERRVQNAKKRGRRTKFSSCSPVTPCCAAFAPGVSRATATANLPLLPRVSQEPQ